MCGITGIHAFNPIGRMHLVHLEAATRCLAHRGPNYQDTWFDHRIGLGHRRLSVIDTSAQANQPLTDATGRYRIIFNGEVYNYQTLRKELADLGHQFLTDSDTEVLLAAFIEWGKACLTRLNGFFAFAIYDQQTEETFIARDRFGIKPLYWFQDDDKILFASQLKSILAYQVPKELDLESLRLYFQLTYIPAPKTIFRNIKKLKPGHYLQIKGNKVIEERYYQLPDSTSAKISDLEEAKPLLQDVLRDAVHERLVADVPLGAFLSGGIDSSVIVALSSEQKKGLSTFSIGYKDHPYFDETHYAELVAEKYQTDHHTIKLGQDDLLASVFQVIEALDEPFADSSALPVYILSQYTRKKVTVALSGDGADEIFSGYQKHAAWMRAANASFQSKLVTNLGPLWSVLPKSRNSQLTDFIRRLDKYAHIAKLPYRERYWHLATFIQESQVERMLKPTFFSEQISVRDDLYEEMNSDSLNEMLSADVRLVLQGDMLTKVDMMSMAHGLEVRVPFLDHRVVNMAFDLQTQLKSDGKTSKIILREAFRDLLPKELYDRPKHGFEVPLLDWFKNELSSELDEKVFNQTRVEAQGIFNWGEIKRIKRKLHSFDPGDSHVLVWSLLVFQHWYDQYMKD